MTGAPPTATRHPSPIPYHCPPRPRELRQARRAGLAEPWALVRWPGRLRDAPSTLEPALLIAPADPHHVRGRLLCHSGPRLIPVALIVGTWPDHPPSWARLVASHQRLDAGGDPTAAITKAAGQARGA